MEVSMFEVLRVRQRNRWRWLGLRTSGSYILLSINDKDCNVDVLMCLGVLFIKGESCCQENSASRGLTLEHMIFQGTFVTARDWRPTCGHVPRRKEGRCHLGRSGIFRFFLVDSTYKQYRAEVRGQTFLPSAKLQRHCSVRYIILGVLIIFVRPIKNEGLKHRNIFFVEILKTPFLKNKWFTRVQKRMQIFTIESFLPFKITRTPPRMYHN